jgi:ABC-type transporter lipoprotein component MlaA
LRVIETRRQLLSTDKARREAADPYVFVREAYLQNRRFQITGEQDDDELEDFEADFEMMLEEEGL